MKRFGSLTLALILLLLAPMAASAQRETRQTREGSKYIGLALTKQSQAERVEMYQQAMTHLRQGMEQDAENARVWLLAGTALAGMGNMTEADAAFDRALTLQPDFQEQVQQERLDAWIAAFQAGVQAMETDAASAQRHFENAELIYEGRPEAKMYLGVIYANEAGDLAKAEQAFRDALAATHGPLFETLDEEGKQEWVSMRSALDSNIERLIMQQGVQDFQEQRYAEATAKFRELTERAPNSRDVWFNYGQAILADAQRQDSIVMTLPAAEQAAAKQKLIETYNTLEEITKRTQQFDPNNELLYMLLVRAHRVRGEYGGTEAATQAGQQAALAVLQAHDALSVTLDDINVLPGEGTATVTGMLKNRKVAAGAAVNLNFELLDREGAVVGRQTITVNAPAAEATVPFEATVPVTGEVSGWRYTVGG